MATPAFLSFPLASGFALESIDIADAFETDSGHTRRRSKYLSVPEGVTCSWLLTQSQFDAFDAWFENELSAGAKSFSWALLGTTQTSMFSEPYAYAVDDRMLYRVSAKLLRGVGVIGSEDGGSSTGGVVIGPPVLPPAAPLPALSSHYYLPEDPGISFSMVYDISDRPSFRRDRIPVPADFTLTRDGTPVSLADAWLMVGAIVPNFSVTQGVYIRVNDAPHPTGSGEFVLSYTPGVNPLETLAGGLIAPFSLTFAY